MGGASSKSHDPEWEGLPSSHHLRDVRSPLYCCGASARVGLVPQEFPHSWRSVHHCAPCWRYPSIASAAVAAAAAADPAAAAVAAASAASRAATRRWVWSSQPAGFLVLGPGPGSHTGISGSGRPRHLAWRASCAHAAMSWFQILRLAPFQAAPETQGGPPEPEAPRPPPGILRPAGGSGRAPLLLLLLGPAPVRREGSPEPAGPGPPPSRGSPCCRCWRRDLGSQNCSRGRGCWTHHPRGALGAGLGV